MSACETVLCLGMFDGVHAGHQALLKEAARLINGGRTVVFTFSNHPAELFSGRVDRLSSNAQRERWLRESGADGVIEVPFTTEFAAQAPEEFLRRLLAEHPAAGLVAGFNYTFGAGGRGTAATLLSFGEEAGIRTAIVPPVMFGGEPVSSTSIREALRAGDLNKAEQMLTRPYTLSGTVIRNRQLGRTLGFPTANTDTGSMVLPPDGVYASRFRLFTGEELPAVTNIGTNPTVNGQKRTVETHIPGFEGDLYGTVSEVSLIKYLREDSRFENFDALREAMKNDIAAALAILRE